MDLITKDSETTLVLFSSLDRVLENVEYVVMNYRPVLNGEHYLTGEEVCKRLCISKRTLQDYRDKGYVPDGSGVSDILPCCQETLYILPLIQDGRTHFLSSSPLT